MQSAEPSKPIEHIHAPRRRIEELVCGQDDAPESLRGRIAGYRFVLYTIHGNAPNIPFEPKYVEQLHGYMARLPGLDRRHVEEARQRQPCQRAAPRCHSQRPFQAGRRRRRGRLDDPLHDRFNAERAASTNYHLLTAGCVFDFLVIRLFCGGNGRMSRLRTLWPRYLGDFQVGVYISREKLIEDSKATSYDPLAKSAVSTRASTTCSPGCSTSLASSSPPTRSSRSARAFGGRAPRRARIERFIKDLAVERVHGRRPAQYVPGGERLVHTRILIDLKKHGLIERVGAGGSKWLRLPTNFGDDERTSRGARRERTTCVQDASRRSWGALNRSNAQV